MTDKRHCDGPTCTTEVTMYVDHRQLGDRTENSFITVTGASGVGRRDLHFCTNNCLSAWTKESTRARH